MAGSRFYEGTSGFMAVPLGAEKMHLGVIKYTGALLYQTEVKNSAAVGVSQPANAIGKVA